MRISLRRCLVSNHVRFRAPAVLLVALIAVLCTAAPFAQAQAVRQATAKITAQGTADQAKPAAQPNIVLLIADDMDFEHFSFLGSPTAKTPAIDRLAASGFTFTTAHLPMSRCHPTLASLLSGRYPHQTGIYYNYGTAVLDPAGSLPNLLKDAGYATFVSGKYWEGDPRAMGFTHGTKDTTLVRQNQDDVNAFLDEVGGKQPFFLWWAPNLPHTPHNASEERLAKFPKPSIPIPDWFTGNRQQYKNREQKSLAMESWLDDGVHDLMAELEKRQLSENTIFVFLIDNGWCNGLVSKGSPFEKGVQTPVIISGPGVKHGQNDELISTLDLFPTILQFAGLTPPADRPGRDLSPALKKEGDGNYEYREALYGAIYPAFVTKGDERPERDIYALYVRTREWKYILYLQDVTQDRNQDYFRIQSIVTEYPTRAAGDQDLYHLTDDPHELKNLSADPAQAERMQQFRADVLRWWKETGGKEIGARD